MTHTLRPAVIRDLASNFLADHQSGKIRAGCKLKRSN